MLESYIEQQNTKNPYTEEQLKTIFQDADQKLEFTKKLIKEINREREELYK